MKKVLLISLVLVLGLATSVLADMIPVGSGDLTGSRSTPEASGVVAYDGWANNFLISWEIKNVGGDYPWSYSYSLTDLDGNPLTKFPSHLIIEVSPEFVLDIDTDIPTEGPKEWTEAEGNPNMPGTLWGIKLDEGLTTYSFLSKVSPIWGDFYSKDGKEGGVFAVAYNSGFGTDPTLSTTDFTSWIPVPDTEGQVPEPSTLLLIGAGLLGLGLYGRGKFRK